MFAMPGESKFEWMAVLVILVLLGIVLVAGCVPYAATETPTPEVTITLTPVFTSVPALTSTPAVRNMVEAKTRIMEEAISPNGEWRALVTITTRGKSQDVLFKVVNEQSQLELIVEEMHFEDTTPMPAVLYPYPLKWSMDNRHLYYSYLSTFTDGCFSYDRPGGQGLKSVDLQTGTVTSMREGWTRWMAFSPDESKLAYIDTFGGNVFVIDLLNNKERKYDLPFIKNKAGLTTDTSDLYWAPDGQSLIYAHYIGACDLVIPMSTIVQLYPETGEQNILIDSAQGYIPTGWYFQDQIWLTDFEHHRWWLDPSSTEITPADQ